MNTDNSAQQSKANETSRPGALDEGILATKRAKNRFIQKIALIGFATCFSAFAVYRAGVYLGGELSDSLGNDTENTSNATTGTSEQLHAAREELQQMLVVAESAVAQIEQDQGRLTWNVSGVSSLRNVLKLAYGSYSAENYLQATKQLNQLQTAVAEFEQDYINTWQTAFSNAQSAWDQSDILQAKLHNQNVLKINPNYGPAQELQARLDVWDRVNEKLDALRVAKVENNLAKQLKIAQEIARLDPQNLDIAEQVNVMQKQIQGTRFSSAIAEARNYLADGNAEAALTSLDKARQIYPMRTEVTQIQSQLDEIAQNNSEARLQQQIATMQSVDNWAAAQKISETAKNKHPDNAQFELSYKLASQILDYQSQLAAYLHAPARLTDTNIRNNAKRLLSQVSDIEVASASLKQQAQQLRDTMSDTIQKVAVTVMSDGRTDIRVLGTGVLGKTREKVIELMPGNYRFEGRRKGYQSKIVAFTVKATDEPQTITLICDQKI